MQCGEAKMKVSRNIIVLACQGTKALNIIQRENLEILQTIYLGAGAKEQFDSFSITQYLDNSFLQIFDYSSNNIIVYQTLNSNG